MDKNIWHDFELLTRDPNALRDFQIQKLKTLLIRVYENSLYYKNKFDRAGLNPHEFNSLEQFSDYPTFDKYEERESQLYLEFY